MVSTFSFIDQISLQHATKYYIWLIFLVSVIGIIISSKYAADYTVALTERTKLKKGLGSSVVLAFIGAIPELFTALISGLLKQPELYVSDVVGSNTFMLFCLSLAAVIFYKRNLFSETTKLNRILASFILTFNVILFFALIPVHAFDWMRVTIPGIDVSWIDFAFLIIYIVFLFIAERYSKTHGDDFVVENSNHEQNKKKNLTVLKIIMYFLIAGIGVVISSILLTVCSRIMEEKTVYNIPSSSAGGLFLGYATALPEIVAFAQLMRLGETKMAVGVPIGSNLIHYIWMIVSDLAFHNQSGQFNRIVYHNENGQVLHWQYFLLICLELVMTAMTLLSMKKLIYKKTWRSISLSSGIMTAYIVVWVVILTFTSLNMWPKAG